MAIYQLRQSKQWFMFNRKRKLRTQIIFIVILFECICILFVYGSLQVNQLIISKEFWHSSKQIFVRETRNQLNSVQIFRKEIELLLEITKKQMDIINKFQQLIPQYQDFQIQQPLECLSNIKLQDEYSMNYSFCYGIFNASSNLTVDNDMHTLMNVTSILQEFLVLGRFRETQVGISHKSPLNFFTMLQKVTLPPKFNPHIRPWYTSHLEQYTSGGDYIFGLPFQSFQGDTKVILTTNWSTTDQMFVGIIAKDIQFIDQWVNIKEQNYKIYLFDNNGIVIYGNQYYIEKIAIFYIFNELITGFSEQDWTQIQLFKNNQSYSNNCSDIYFIPHQALCLYNSIEKKEVLIRILDIRDTNYQILIYNILDDFKIEEQHLFNFFNQQIEEISYYYLILDIVTFPILLMFAGCITTNFLKQTYHLISYQNQDGLCKHQNCKKLRSLKHFLKIRLNRELFSSIPVENLYRSMKQLVRNTIDRNLKQINDIERIKYPETSYMQQQFQQDHQLQFKDIRDTQIYNPFFRLYSFNDLKKTYILKCKFKQVYYKNQQQ